MIYGKTLTDTAKAWGISKADLYEIVAWVEYNVPEHERKRAFVGLLKRRYSAGEQNTNTLA